MALSAGYKGHRCVVPNCNSGYDSCKEKVHLFSVPKEEELRKKWENAIPRANFILKSGLVVCHKHFLPEEIITKREVKDPQGNVMASETLKKPYPVKGSVPSQFPNCPAYLSKPMRKRKKPKDRSALDGNFKKKRKNNKEDHVSDLINENCDNAVEINYLNSQPSEKTSENTDIIHDTGLPENVETFQNDTNHSAEDLNSPLNDDSSEFNLTLIERQRVFDEIFNNKNSIDITGGWNRRQVEENFKCIEITKCISRKVQNTIKFVSSKKIILLPDLEIQIEISGIPVSIDKVGLENNISSVKDIENVMITLDNIKTCTGCAESNATRNVETSVAMRDCNGVLRHFKCPVVITESNKISRCKFCASTRKVLSNKYMRLKKHKQMKQLNLKLSNPAEQKKLMTMRTLYYKAQRKKKFYQDKYRDCVSELSKCQKEMSSYTDEKIEEKLLNHNISINERLVIKEILKSSKHDNKKGNRYSQEWILQCLLFHMRSPAAYRMLRDAKLLPLPCTSTIRKYLSLVDTPCGFDSNYLELFSEHLAKLPELLRHGILLLDEISTRKNVRLNTKTMEFSGLTDFGDNNSTTTVNEQADHGLVLMYHPLMESFAQPIAVCTSKGPVSGENLSKLIIQAIVVLEKAGAQIHGVVTDSATTNRKFWTMVGVSGELDGVQSWFPHPTVESRKVFVFADTPHLFKNIRNCLYNRKKLQVSSKDKPILWKHIELLYECDSKNMNARLCPKLTQQHIKPDFMLKMRVNLAVQVLSRSVGTALLKMKNYFPDLFDGCEATAEFCLRMNNLFDNLNEITPEKGLRPGSANYNELRKFLEWLDSWERRVLSSEILESDFLPKPTATGLRVTINSTIELSEILLDKCKFNYVLTGYINQDPLEYK
ncbi:uncharacterized protein LOC122511737 isoform X2 [Leptopilina heterotoma]|uniref:uncharacterized protein LOC122511737 isoform X2 n=1 Tax=Leptopilina heterotoma TaxID=63436 RepID=UPI001CA91BA8|nr:uncharacterized protein LOC122511737 isoform X2 [Leptopilina heterotoma]